jgi:hypothetical protein
MAVSDQPVQMGVRADQTGEKDPVYIKVGLPGICVGPHTDDSLSLNFDDWVGDHPLFRHGHRQLGADFHDTPPGLCK